jgi:hypothetical protein
VGGGAQHSPEIARVLSYAAFGGAEGIVGSDDLAVREKSVPDSTVQVLPGACSILNRASAQAYQAYVGRLPSAESVAIAPTDASGGRSDLIVVRVEDPYLAGEPWGDPVDPAIGPYVFTRVIPNVPAGTTSLQQVEPGQSGIAIARIDLPASTGTVTQAMIQDLRVLPNPRRERRQMLAFPSSSESLTSGNFVRFPGAAQWSVQVPSWATKAIVRGEIAGVKASGSLVGTSRVLLGSLVGQVAPFDFGSGTRGTVLSADEFSIPVAMRGTTQTLQIQGKRNSGTGSLESGGWITALSDIEFVESV